MHWNNHHFRSKSYAVAMIPKAGSTSIGEVLPEFQGVPTVPTFAFPRDPLDRLGSVYWFFVSQGRRARYWSTYEQCVDVVLSGAVNVHWWPQAELLSGFSDLTLYRFEDINQVWREIGFPALPHRNKSNRRPIAAADYRLDELLEYYAADFELRKLCRTLET